MTTTQSPSVESSNARVTVRGPDHAGGEWRVVEQDGTVVVLAEKRGEAREQARLINAERAAKDAAEANIVQEVEVPEVTPEPEAPVQEVEIQEPEDSDDSPAFDVAADEAKADTLTADAEPEAPEVAPEPEQPTEVVDEIPLTIEKPARAAGKRAVRKDKVPMVRTRVGALLEGDTLVRNDIGTVKVTGLSKTGKGEMEIAFEREDGTADVFATYAATHARRLYREGEVNPDENVAATHDVTNPEQVDENVNPTGVVDQPVEDSGEQAGEEQAEPGA